MPDPKRRPEEETPETRIKRGCIGVAILLVAMTWLLIIQTENLAWSLLLILVVLVLLARQYLV